MEADTIPIHKVANVNDSVALMFLVYLFKEWKIFFVHRRRVCVPDDKDSVFLTHKGVYLSANSWLVVLLASSSVINESISDSRKSPSPNAGTVAGFSFGLPLR